MLEEDGGYANIDWQHAQANFGFLEGSWDSAKHYVAIKCTDRDGNPTTQYFDFRTDNDNVVTVYWKVNPNANAVESNKGKVKSSDYKDYINDLKPGNKVFVKAQKDVDDAKKAQSAAEEAALAAEAAKSAAEQAAADAKAAQTAAKEAAAKAEAAQTAA